MTGRKRLLVDVRDDSNLRGFHALAALYLIADELQSVELYRLGGDAQDERIALRSFSFDTGLKFRGIWRLLWVDSKFDFLLSAANVLPQDPASIAARKTSRRMIFALMFDNSSTTLPIPGIILNGHDTANIARTVVDELRTSAEVAIS